MTTRDRIISFLISLAIAIGLYMIATSSSGASAQFLDAIERIESNGNPHAIGDNGRARGPYQFWATAWADCSRARSKQGLSVAPYWGATNRAVARSYAMTYLGMLESSLTRALRRTPTHAELYAAWNMGFTAYRRTGFSLSRCPESTRRAAARINSMLALSQGGAASKGRMHNVASMAVERR
jgi:hypothetical protein